MSRKKIKRLDSSSGIARTLTGMKFKELQRACVARGMAFEEVVSADYHGLQTWFINHQDNGQSLTRLDEFDGWIQEQLIAAGYPADDPMHHPSLRLGFIAQKNDDGEITKTKKPRLKGLEKKKKPKAERLKGTTILTGTKKAMTYQAAMAGISLEKAKEKVLEAYPDANLKSIQNWYKRCQKEMGANK